MNQQLAEERAEVVRAALVERGVDSKQLEVRAFADRQPADGIARPYARASERRAEFVAVPRPSPAQPVK
jgi:outer membrane protein OmpA-like peptidoglycan-associated protein